ncbi:AMP-binding protein [Streptomyces sp. Wh19]|uniref:AMP-binding protein n=1 Tax=Streptomyces sp. Wh19 TaxID=3076629 RepID=UPI002958DE4C|nr:AMP-binding protein [Streptomyces sp. Wh19]MDV9194476.1 AMP-binding protein [Streptomyces sp. Wh19]
MGDWFRRGLRRAPDGVALRIDDRSWTYRSLRDLALQWADTLMTADRSGPVGVLAARSIECYAGILAAAEAGAAVVPLSPAFPTDRTVVMAKAAGVTRLVVDAWGAQALEPLLAAMPDLQVLAPDRRVKLPTQVRRLAVSEGTAPSGLAGREADNRAYILFTSGSTGRPKGVTISNANLSHFLTTNLPRYGFTPEDSLSQTFDCTFDLAMFDLFMAWASGATVVSTPLHALRALPDFIARHSLTGWFSVPSSIALVRRYGGLAAGSMPSLRWSLFCGEGLAASDAQAWQAAAPGSVLENLYGPTELTIACSVYRWDPQVSPNECVRGLVPVGALYSGLDGMLLDGDRPSSTGEGELCVRGPQVFPGYLDQSDDVSRLFRYAGARWYRTGDRMRVTAAGLSYLGRTDHQVQIQGSRVELTELNWCVSQLPRVESAVAFTFKEGGLVKIALAYVGPDGCEVEIRARLSERLPGFMVPRKVFRVPRLPLNSNGKVDWEALMNLIE